MEILYCDDRFVAVNKPNGLLVHRTSIADDAQTFALQQTRDMTGKMVYPVHRLDRPTSGVLLFAFSSEIAHLLHSMLADGQIRKQYRALLRGWMEAPQRVETPVKSEKGKLQEAETSFCPLKHHRLPFPVGPYPEARFTEVEIAPLTGRWHQIRQHAAHLRHYIVNDRVHGCRHNNRLFAERLDIRAMFLHAERLEFAPSPDFPNLPCSIEAPFPDHWRNVLLR